jgi:hypothetical protein
MHKIIPIEPPSMEDMRALLDILGDQQAAINAMTGVDVSKILNETSGKPALPPLPFKAEKPTDKK